MQFRNLRMVDRMVFGRGSFNQLAGIIEPKRNNGCIIFLIDHFFTAHALIQRLPVQPGDQLIYVDTTHEPTTENVDRIVSQLRLLPSISVIIGIGGGSTMDMAKAVAVMFNNPGSATDYQGWDLVNNAAIYKVGIPTLSGTGAEVSRTAVLCGPEKKLGINSDYTTFDQVILDPDLIRHVPEYQRFFTGMDCYIHSIESLQGTYLNAFSRSHAQMALALCREIFLQNDEWDDASDEKLMMASYAGGMSIAYSQVGVVHAISYGLSYVLNTPHGLANCIVMNRMNEFYPEATTEFKTMVAKNNIMLPENTCANCSPQQLDSMVRLALSMTPLWENALGKDWRNRISSDQLRTIYKTL